MILTQSYYGERKIVAAYLGTRAVPISLMIDASALAGLLTGARTGQHISPETALPCTLAGGATGERNAAHVEASVIADRTDGGILAGQTAFGIVDTFVNGEVLGGELIGHRADEGVVSDTPSLGGAIGGSGAGHQVEAHRTDTAVLPRAASYIPAGERNAAYQTSTPVTDAGGDGSAAGAKGFASVEDSRYALAPGTYTYRNPNNGARPANAGDYLPCDISFKIGGVTYTSDGIFWEGYPGKGINYAKMYADRACTVQIGEYRQGTGYVLTTDNAEIELLSDPYFDYTHYWIWNIDLVPTT